MRLLGYALAWTGFALVVLYAIVEARTNGQVVMFPLYVAALWLAGWSLLPERVR